MKSSESIDALANSDSSSTPAPPVSGLALLRVPFPAHQISKLPKESKQQIEARKTDRSTGINCRVCGGWHHKNAVHLDYVGHAALTNRLLDADPMWSWEPMHLNAGLPAFDEHGGLWIRLTVCGVSRLGYGHAQGKDSVSEGDRIKEVIGDALRNAAMRFGAAIDLWHKGDLHAADGAHVQPPPVKLVTAEQAANIEALAGEVGADVGKMLAFFNASKYADIAMDDYSRVIKLLESKRKQP